MGVVFVCSKCTNHISSMIYHNTWWISYPFGTHRPPRLLILGMSWSLSSKSTAQTLLVLLAKKEWRLAEKGNFGWNIDSFRCKISSDWQFNYTIEKEKPRKANWIEWKRDSMLVYVNKTRLFNEILLIIMQRVLYKILFCTIKHIPGKEFL